MPEKEEFVDKVMEEVAIRSVRERRDSDLLFRWTTYPGIRYFLMGAAAAFFILFAVQNVMLFQRVQRVEDQVGLSLKEASRTVPERALPVHPVLEKLSRIEQGEQKMGKEDWEQVLQDYGFLIQRNKEIQRFLNDHPEIKKMVEQETSLFDGVPKVKL